MIKRKIFVTMLAMLAIIMLTGFETVDKFSMSDIDEENILEIVNSNDNSFEIIDLDEVKNENYISLNIEMIDIIMKDNNFYNKYVRLMNISEEAKEYAINNGIKSIYNEITLFNRNNEEKIFLIKDSFDAINTNEWFYEKSTILYQKGKGNKVYFLDSEVEEALNSKKYFRTYKEACPPIIPKPIKIDNKLSRNINNEINSYEQNDIVENSGRLIYSAFAKSNFSVEELDKILSNTNLSGCGIFFKNMEDTYGVNSLFAIAVAGTESTWGKHCANKNNFWGRKAKGGGWMSFSSKESSIMSFGDYISGNLYSGKSIDGIGKIYCEGGSWSNTVKSLMKSSYSKL